MGSHLEVHHPQFRTHAEEDSDETLITLSHNCHSGTREQSVGASTLSRPTDRSLDRRLACTPRLSNDNPHFSGYTERNRLRTKVIRLTRMPIPDPENA
jgi:hypothetical protein